MKKFILRILVFFTFVAMIDIAFGYLCRYLNSNAESGDTQNHYYIAKECDKDILVFGSSRSMHHYVPKIIEDSLGMSCYNCGVDGYGIVYLYSRLLVMTERYVPKVLIYDIQANFDIAEGDNAKYLGYQKRLYDEPGVSDVFTLVNFNERYKMWSNLYRYNGDFIQMLSDNIYPIHEVEYGGYRPVRKQMKYEPVVKETTQLAKWDSVKKECMMRLVDLCKKKGILLIFTYSPSYGGFRPSCDDIVNKFVEENKLILLNHYSDPNFCMTKEFFYDSVHMNDKGATEFTKMFVGELLSKLKIGLKKEPYI